MSLLAHCSYSYASFKLRFRLLHFHYACGPTSIRLPICRTQKAVTPIVAPVPSMYIPQPHSLQTDPFQVPEGTSRPNRIVDHDPSSNIWPTVLQSIGQRVSNSALPVTDNASRLWRRTTSTDINTTIGIIVGVLLGVFLIASCTFLYIYRRSIRVKKRRRQRHHRKSSSSKGSKASDSGGSAAPPPPA